MRAVCFRVGHGPAGLVDALEAIDAEVMDVRHCLYRNDPRVLGARLEKIGQLAAAALTTVNRVEKAAAIEHAVVAIDRAWQDANEAGGQ